MMKFLTLKVPITTAGDVKVCDIGEIRLDISFKSSAGGRRFK